MLLLQLFQLVVIDLLQHLAFDLFFLLSELDNQLVLLSHLLEVLLDLLVDALV